MKIPGGRPIILEVSNPYSEYRKVNLLDIRSMSRECRVRLCDEDGADYRLLLTSLISSPIRPIRMKFVFKTFTVPRYLDMAYQSAYFDRTGTIMPFHPMFAKRDVDSPPDSTNKLYYEINLDEYQREEFKADGISYYVLGMPPQSKLLVYIYTTEPFTERENLPLKIRVTKKEPSPATIDVRLWSEESTQENALYSIECLSWDVEYKAIVSQLPGIAYEIKRIGLITSNNHYDKHVILAGYRKFGYAHGSGVTWEFGGFEKDEKHGAAGLWYRDFSKGDHFLTHQKEIDGQQGDANIYNQWILYLSGEGTTLDLFIYPY